MRDPALRPVPISSHLLCHSRHLITAPPKHLRKTSLHVLRRLQHHPQVRITTRHADCAARRGRNPLGRGSPAVACPATSPSAIGGRHNRCNFRLASRTHGWVATSLTLLLHRQTAPKPNMHLVSAGFANHQSNMLPLCTAPQLNRRPDAERSPSWYNSCSKCGEQGIVRFTNPQDRIRTPAPIPASMLHRQLPP
jgi:hypothetical protein